MQHQKRARSAAAEARTEAAREAVQAAKDRIQEVLETTPEALLENLNTDAERMPPSDQVEAEVNRLKRQRDALGAVNCVQRKTHVKLSTSMLSC